MDKVYIVIEEYDPYIDYPNISSRAELTIHGVFKNIEDALACRREFVEAEEEEYDVDEIDKISEEQYNNPHSQLKQLNSTYYISEYEVQ